MEFSIYKAGERIVTFDDFGEAKDVCSRIIAINNQAICIIEKVQGKYIIRTSTPCSEYFIDDIIDFINEYQYENDHYIICTLLKHYDTILTIEQDYNC